VKSFAFALTAEPSATLDATKLNDGNLALTDSILQISWCSFRGEIHQSFYS
jgi:hypothetical protein